MDTTLQQPIKRARRKAKRRRQKGDGSIVDTNVSECREIPTMAVLSDIAMLQQLSELQWTLSWKKWCRVSAVPFIFALQWRSTHPPNSCAQPPTAGRCSPPVILKPEPQVRGIRFPRKLFHQRLNDLHPSSHSLVCAFAEEQVRSVAMNPSVRPGDMGIANSLNRIVGDWPATF